MRGNNLVPLDLEIGAIEETTLQEEGNSNKRCRVIKERGPSSSKLSSLSTVTNPHAFFEERPQRMTLEDYSCSVTPYLQTWEEVVEKFLKKYFPESKTVERKVEISSFHQLPDESLSEALDHFHGLLQNTPTHGFREPIQFNIFIDDLRPHSKQLLDASVGGKIKLRTSEEAMELIENMTTNDHAMKLIENRDKVTLFFLCIHLYA
ncbi:hypothetical protein HKD37_16G046042 [Glycine soja]